MRASTNLVGEERKHLPALCSTDMRLTCPSLSQTLGCTAHRAKINKFKKHPIVFTDGVPPGMVRSKVNKKDQRDEV